MCVYEGYKVYRVGTIYDVHNKDIGTHVPE